jgi:hypothetical protein
MSFQPKEEKDAEKLLIERFAVKIGAEPIKLQDYDDDGKTDGIIQLISGKTISVEARRKGFENHSGRACLFRDGWNTRFLVNDGGIFLNEMTIRNYRNKGFVFIVEIRGSSPRACIVDEKKVEILLNQPNRKMKSTNSGVMQSVKTVPLDWFTFEF